MLLERAGDYLLGSLVGGIIASVGQSSWYPVSCPQRAMMGTPGALHEVDIIADKVFIFWKKMNEMEVHRNINTLRRLSASASVDTRIEATRLIGLLYVRNKLYDQAISHFHEALDLIRKHGYQDNGTLIMDIGDAHYKAGRFQAALDRALDAADQMGEFAWKSPILLLNTAQALHGVGRWEDAIELYQQAVKIANMEDAPTLFWLAEVSATLQYYDESIAYLARLLTVRYGASPLPPFEHVDSYCYEGELDLPPAVEDALDFLRGRRDQLRSLPELDTIEVSPDLQQATLEVMDAFAPARSRATIAALQQVTAHAE